MKNFVNTLCDFGFSVVRSDAYEARLVYSTNAFLVLGLNQDGVINHSIRITKYGEEVHVDAKGVWGVSYRDEQMHLRGDKGYSVVYKRRRMDRYFKSYEDATKAVVKYLNRPWE